MPYKSIVENLWQIPADLNKNGKETWTDYIGYNGNINDCLYS